MAAVYQIPDDWLDGLDQIDDVVSAWRNGRDINADDATAVSRHFMSWSESCASVESLRTALLAENAASLAVVCTTVEMPDMIRWSAWTFLSIAIEDKEIATQLFLAEDMGFIKHAIGQIAQLERLGTAHIGILKVLSTVFNTLPIANLDELAYVLQSKFFHRMLRMYMGFDEWCGRHMNLDRTLEGVDSANINAMLGADIDPFVHFSEMPFMRSYCGNIMCGIAKVICLKLDALHDDNAAKETLLFGKEGLEETGKKGGGRRGGGDPYNRKELIRKTEASVFSSLMIVVRDINDSFQTDSKGIERFLDSSRETYQLTFPVRCDGRESLIKITLENLVDTMGASLNEPGNSANVSDISILVANVVNKPLLRSVVGKRALEVGMILASNSRNVLWLAPRLDLDALVTHINKTDSIMQYRLLLLVRQCCLRPKIMDRFFASPHFLDALNHIVESSTNECLIAECLCMLFLAISDRDDPLKCIKRHALHDTLLCLDNHFNLKEHTAMCAAICAVLTESIEA